jgi:hypothetical protein
MKSNIIALLLTLSSITSLSSQSLDFNWRIELTQYLNHGHIMYEEARKISEPFVHLNDTHDIINYFKLRDNLDYNVYLDQNDSKIILYLVDNKNLVKRFDSLKKINADYELVSESLMSSNKQIIKELCFGYIEKGKKMVCDLKNRMISRKMLKIEFGDKGLIDYYEEYNNNLHYISFSIGAYQLPVEVMQTRVIHDSSYYLTVRYLPDGTQIRSIQTYETNNSIKRNGYSFENIYREKRPETISYYQNGVILYRLDYFRRWIKATEFFGDIENKNISILYFYNLNYINRLNSVVYYDSNYDDSRIYSIRFKRGKPHSRIIYLKDHSTLHQRELFFNRKHHITKIKEK